MLRPQYTRRPFELMLLGPPYSGKRTISIQLLKCRDVFFSMNVASDLPKKNIERTDFILIMIDMTNRGCLDLLRRALSQIKADYLSNKLAIVITKVDIPEHWTFEKSDIEELVEPYADLQLFYVNLDNQSDRKATVDQITRLVKINTLQYQNIDIEYMKSQEYFYNLGNELAVKEDSTVAEDSPSVVSNTNTPIMIE